MRPFFVESTADGGRSVLYGSTVSGSLSRRKCCSKMKIPAVILVFLAVVACQPAETVPGEIDPARSDPVRSDPVRSDRAKPAAEKTVVESALVTVIEEVEMPAKVEGVLAAVDVREGQMIEAGAV